MSARIVAQLDVVLTQDDQAGVYVSHCPALDVYSQGLDQDTAMKAIESAVFLYLTTAFEHDRLEQVLRRTGKLKKVPSVKDAVASKQFVAVERDAAADVRSVEVPLYLLTPNASNSANPS